MRDPISGIKTKPVPTRFRPEEHLFLHDASEKTGLSISELVRRCVRLTRKHKMRSDSYSFLLDLPR